MISRYNKVALHLNDTSNNKLIAPNCNTYSTQESTSARRKPSGPRVADPYTEEDRFDLCLISNQSARDAQMPHNYGIQSVTTTSPALQCCQYSWLSERLSLWFSASAGFEINWDHLSHRLPSVPSVVESQRIIQHILKLSTSVLHHHGDNWPWYCGHTSKLLVLHLLNIFLKQKLNFFFPFHSLVNSSVEYKLPTFT